jgi:hypothetical protein
LKISFLLDHSTNSISLVLLLLRDALAAWILTGEILNDPATFPVADFLDSSYSNEVNTDLLNVAGTKFIVSPPVALSLISTLISISPDLAISIPVNFHPVFAVPILVPSYSSPAITNLISSTNGLSTMS